MKSETDQELYDRADAIRVAYMKECAAEFESCKEASEESSADESSPYVVPPLDVPHKPGVYTWWSWHPRYPYWSKSCWEEHTLDEVLKWLKSPHASSLHYYHNKLTYEQGGRIEEILDLPCRRMDVWHKIKEKEEQP